MLLFVYVFECFACCLLFWFMILKKIDIDECKDDALNKCGSNSVCVNIPGGHRCECEVGYKMINGQCHSKCDDCCKRNAKLFLHGQIVPTDDVCSKCKCEVSLVLK